MEKHINILGWVFILFHAFGLLAGIGIFVLLSGLGLLSGGIEAAGILLLIGIVVGGLLIVLSLPGIIGGIGLLKRRKWGRILAIIIGVLNLAQFPFGTVLGIYTLWVLMSVDVAPLFD